MEGRFLSSEHKEQGIRPGIVQWYRSQGVRLVITGLIADGMTNLVQISKPLQPSPLHRLK
jgi:hypothetical protein